MISYGSLKWLLFEETLARVLQAYKELFVLLAQEMFYMAQLFEGRSELNQGSFFFF